MVVGNEEDSLRKRAIIGPIKLQSGGHSASCLEQ